MKFPLPDNDQVFESLIRDVLRLHYHDPSIELFGRSGQTQDSIDGLSTIVSVRASPPRRAKLIGQSLLEN